MGTLSFQEDQKEAVEKGLITMEDIEMAVADASESSSKEAGKSPAKFNMKKGLKIRPKRSNKKEKNAHKGESWGTSHVVRVILLTTAGCDPNWRRNRKPLADCGIGFGRNAIGGHDGRFYVVTDSRDDNPISRRPGTLQHAVILDVPLWIVL